MNPGAAEGIFPSLVEQQLPFGVFVLDRAGRVIATNQTAQGMLDRGDGLALGQGRLVAARKSDTATLRRRIADVCCGSAAASGGSVLDLPRPEPRSDLVVLVVPMSAPARTALREGPAAVVIATCPEEQAAQREELLRRGYGLTSAEAQVALLLLEGTRPFAIAKRRGTSLNTARTHIKRILDKVGVRSQIDLVRTLLTGPSRAGVVSREPRSRRPPGRAR